MLSLGSLAIYIIGTNIALLLLCTLYIFNKKRLLKKSVKDITEFIQKYFMNAEAEVLVTCFKLEGYKHFVVLIQSQASKRFRCSNILESNLITHIFDATGNKVEKIYWRFPISLTKESGTTGKHSPDSDDSYFSDGVAMAEAAGEYKVSEVSWDQYEDEKKKDE